MCEESNLHSCSSASKFQYPSQPLLSVSRVFLKNYFLLFLKIQVVAYHIHNFVPCFKKLNDTPYRENWSQSVVSKEFSFSFFMFTRLSVKWICHNQCVLPWWMFRLFKMPCCGYTFKFFHRYHQISLHRDCTNLYSHE